MCGIAGVVGPPGSTDASSLTRALVEAQHHRGPDAQTVRSFAGGRVALGVDRLRVIDLDPHADGVLSTPDGRWHLAYNGEVYNHVELRDELRPHHDFRTRSDGEVVLAAWSRWGPGCLERLVGMFALLVWDDERQELHAARDRFGVKPLHLHEQDGRLAAASEVGALLAGGVAARPDVQDWASYLVTGRTSGTFWTDVHALAPGTTTTWGAEGRRDLRWYDLVEAVGPELDGRSDDDVGDEVLTLLAEVTRLRFRSDVAVGIALSSGLDSTSLLGLVDRTPGAAPTVPAFTFTTGDAAYDEDAEVASLVRGGRHVPHTCRLHAEDVPALASDLHQLVRQPYGGVPTLAYARLFEHARAAGVTVILDGQGMDEAWAGYDYHRAAASGDAPVVQGGGAALAPSCVAPELRAGVVVPPYDGATFEDPLRRLQQRDLLETKLPRALRYNDAVSMRSSVELREPFLDHRLVELALRQPAARTVGDGEGKALLRRLAPRWRPEGAPAVPAKRPVQTPQREWLRGPLRGWAASRIDAAVDRWGGSLLVADEVQRRWQAFLDADGGNAHAPWQWIGLGLEAERGT
jgi:asparagine synthase (glutamine-hydrolysing)